MPRLKGTLTIRLSMPALRQLKLRAREMQTTPSDLVRGVLEREMMPADLENGPSAYELSRKWVGKIDSRSVVPGRRARAALRDWKPDRRG